MSEIFFKARKVQILFQKILTMNLKSASIFWKSKFIQISSGFINFLTIFKNIFLLFFFFISQLFLLEIIKKCFAFSKEKKIEFWFEKQQDKKYFLEFVSNVRPWNKKKEHGILYHFHEKKFINHNISSIFSQRLFQNEGRNICIVIFWFMKFPPVNACQKLILVSTNNINK